jgi:hypothetical protein
LQIFYVGFLVSVFSVFVGFDAYANENSFKNVAKKAGLQDALGYGKGVSIIDVDGDGWEDIWDLDTNIRRGGKASNARLFLNQGDGTFKPVDAGVDPSDVEFAWGASWADFDNDGDPDLLIASGGLLHDAKLALYENRWKTEKRLVNISDSAGLTQERKFWWGGSWADFNNDGCLDFVAIARKERVWLYQSGCDKTFTEVSKKLGIVVEFKDGKNPVWLDFDNDGDQDLYIGASLQHRLYRNDGAAGFVDVTRKLGEGLMATPFVFAAFAADLNHDGNLDLYLGRQIFQDLIAFGRPDGTFVVEGPGVGIVAKVSPDESENTMGLGYGDINDDGYVDVLIGTGGPSERYFDLVFCGVKTPDNPHGLSFERCGKFTRKKKGHRKKQTHGIAVGDLDQDGSNDIFFNLGGSPTWDLKHGTESRARNAYYVKREPSENTATVLLQGSKSNRDAIGARMTVTVSPGNVFHYVVSSAQSFQSQNSRWQIINMMDSKQAEIRVQWPSGSVTKHVIKVGERKILPET